MAEESKLVDQTTELASKIEETDEMKLKMLKEAMDVKNRGVMENNVEEDNDVLYPAELNAHLFDQLQTMTEENTALRKCVCTKDKEIKELNKTIVDLNNRIRDIITATGPAISCKSAGIISSKITELCKQNRHLIAENESYKTKNAALTRKIMQIEESVKGNEKLELSKEEIPEVSPDELKMLNTKLAVVNKKLCESKNRNLKLKNDILLATKILQQELGDKFISIKELQNDLAGWKGRAQQITTLQARVTELESKLNIKHKDLLDAKHNDQSQVIRDLEAKRKKEVETTMKEIESIKKENLDLKKKLDGSKARIRNLECEILAFKQKIQTYNEKSSHDDLLIQEQKSQIRNLELHYQEILNDNTYKMNKLKNKISEIEMEKENANFKVEAILKQCSEKAAKIEELRNQLRRYEECSLQNVLFSPMRTATDVEIQTLSHLVKTLNERVDTERRRCEELETAQMKLKEKRKKLERKVTFLEEELRLTKEQFSRRASRPPRISKDPQKLSETSNKLMKSPSQISQEKISSGDMTSEYLNLEDLENLDKDALKYKLELAEEKLKMMEDKLKMVEEEKIEDVNQLTEMIHTSKQLFNEALVTLQKNKCVCS